MTEPEPTNESNDVSTGPSGAGDYEVQQGDCLSSIAFAHGHFWKTLWQLGANSELKKQRKNADILLPGDYITIPPLRVKKVSGATDKRHRFQLLGVPVKLRLHFLDSGEPLSGEPYALRVDGDERSGNLDNDGRLEETILPSARKAEIRLGDRGEWLQVQLGSVDPITEISGVQCRLSNLGFSVGDIDGLMGPITRAAIRRFQKTYKLDPTGEPNQETCNKLVEVHGC